MAWRWSKERRNKLFVLLWDLKHNGMSSIKITVVGNFNHIWSTQELSNCNCMHCSPVNATAHFSLVHNGLHTASSEQRIGQHLGFNPQLGKKVLFRCSVQKGYFPKPTGDLSRDVNDRSTKVTTHLHPIPKFKNTWGFSSINILKYTYKLLVVIWCMNKGTTSYL